MTKTFPGKEEPQKWVKEWQNFLFFLKRMTQTTRNFLHWNKDQTDKSLRRIFLKKQYKYSNKGNPSQLSLMNHYKCVVPSASAETLALLLCLGHIWVSTFGQWPVAPRKQQHKVRTSDQVSSPFHLCFVSWDAGDKRQTADRIKHCSSTLQFTQIQDCAEVWVRLICAFKFKWKCFISLTHCFVLAQHHSLS